MVKDFSKGLFLIITCMFIKLHTCWGHCGFSSGQTEAVVVVGCQQVVAAVLVLVPFQVLMNLVNQ